MNAHDLAAARRLIAQFEDRAVGRHNSTMLPSRETELPVPQAVQRRDRQDARSGRMTIEQQEIEYQFREAFDRFRRIAAGSIAANEDYVNLVKGELEELKRLRLLALDARKILNLAKYSLQDRHGPGTVIYPVPTEPSFYEDRRMQTEQWSRERIAVALYKLSIDLCPRP